MADTKRGRTIGIDLGTTNSVVALMEGGEPMVIQNAEGHRTTPSVVAYTGNGERLVGQSARNQMITNPERTIYSIKRFMGLNYDEAKEEVNRVGYQVVRNSNGEVRIQVGEKELSPPEISAAVLQKMKQTAEDYLGEEVTQAVVTVPAYFNDSQRQATKDAGRIAGLEVKRIVNEPTAAALAYGFGKKKANEKIAVYDLGGGTFDISILEIDNIDGENVFEVRSTNGDTHLGGDNFDQQIIDWLVSNFRNDYGVDLSQDRMALQRLKEGAENAKKELSSSQSSDINLPFITADNSGPKHLNYNLTRAKFEQLVDDLIQRTKAPCEQALADADMKPGDIDQVILVGGSTRIPAVQKLVTEIFDREPNKSVNPDEVVALGAAVQAAVLSGDVKDVQLLDVTPLSLGIETLGGVFTRLIERNTTIPTRKSEVFSTAEDNQTQVSIHVLQGEREKASENRTLGRFELLGIPPASRGVPQIEVTFDIDANGIVHVTAKDLGTGKEQKIRIESSSGLNEEEINKMVRDAEQHAEEDKRHKETVEVRNQADSLIYSTEKTLEEHGDKVSESERSAVQEKIDALRSAMENNDLQAMQSGIEALQQAAQPLAQKLYEQQGQQQAAGAAGGNSGSNGTAGQSGSSDDVEDADYEVVND